MPQRVAERWHTVKSKLWKTIKSRPYLITFCAVFVLIFLRFGISSIQRGKATAFVLLGIAIIAAVLSFPLVRIENLIRKWILEYKIKKLNLFKIELFCL